MSKPTFKVVECSTSSTDGTTERKLYQAGLTRYRARLLADQLNRAQDLPSEGSTLLSYLVTDG